MRHTLKAIANAVSLILVSPCALTCWLEKQLTSHGEAVFTFWTHVFAVLPGHPGLFLRRAFYRLTLDECADSFYIGFGALFTHRRARVERNVYIGPYSLIGCAVLREACLIGSRASLLSGTELHKLDDEGRWSEADLARLRVIEIGPQAWVGEGAIVMVDVGKGAMVGAGAVVSTRVRPGVVVAGNPARYVRRLKPEVLETTGESEHTDAASTPGLR